MKTITLRNEIHKTSVNIKVEGRRISAYQAKRIKKTLCPNKNCQCSTNEFKLQGENEFNIRPIKAAYSGGTTIGGFLS